MLAGVALVAALVAGGGARAADGHLWPELFNVRAPVEDQSNLEPAFRHAMQQMLVRVTGLRQPERAPGVAETFDHAETYIERYFLESTTAADGSARLVLLVQFDPDAIRELVDRLELGWWSRIRPQVLAWVVFEDETGRKVYAESGSGAGMALRAAADARAVPLVLPLFDAEDRAALPASMLWGGFPEPIERASARYRAAAVLVGRVHRSGTGLWNARWTILSELVEGGNFQTDGTSLEAAVGEGMQQIADRLAERFALRGGAGAPVPAYFRVSGVEQLEDYARVLDYLAAIDIIEDVQVARLEPSHAGFHIRVRGGLRTLADLLVLDRVLAPVGEEEEGQVAGGDGRSGSVEPGDEATWRLR